MSEVISYSLFTITVAFSVSASGIAVKFLLPCSCTFVVPKEILAKILKKKT